MNFLKDFNLEIIKLSDHKKMPREWGIYVFLNEHRFPLYIGMSKNIRNRILCHLRDKTSGKVRMVGSTTYLGYIVTTGELSTRLLESYLIKKYMPITNKALRKEHFLVTGEMNLTKGGYKSIEFKRIQNFDALNATNSCGVFRSISQAKEIANRICMEYSLCPKLLGLESGKGACFNYHIKKCSGACGKNITAEEYNHLLDEAMSNYRVAKWKYGNEIVIKEKTEGKIDEFTLYNWSVIKHRSNYINKVLEDRNFEFDCYKIIRSYLSTKLLTR